ncbi:hypothetical protein AQ490_19895 [Wenjunlia vitaminophila]|uniref:OmpR/PhoB-type domain-containing protein n=1 Tax=Wenjunlia vitaminophila TaxID=76728 RepID=A0A0T6LU20_WENVI|nr:tetratricopeptide repeat protein [Wenjunlia vitaminophila]KRV49587.1 hypothetical protein AQ490_19895 [Wenjunlia vitaminophila]
MRLQVLGQVRVWRGGIRVDLGPPERRAVLGLLALACGRPVPGGELVSALWGSRPPEDARVVLREQVGLLREALEPRRPAAGPGVVLSEVGDGYVLRLPPDRVDLLRFRRLVAAAGAARHRGDQLRAVSLLAEAVHLWRQPPLADLPTLRDHRWVVSLADERRAAVERYSEALLAVGTATEVPRAPRGAAGVRPQDQGAPARSLRACKPVVRGDQARTGHRANRRRIAEQHGASSCGVPRQLPADTPVLHGRVGELAALDGWLAQRSAGGGRHPLVSVVSGPAGVGKSALAVHWAHRTGHRFPGGQLYVNLRGGGPGRSLAAGDALVWFLDALGCAGPIPLDLDARAQRYRTEMSGRRMLVVLDNARSVQQVRPLLPRSPSCVTVVTSRNGLNELVAEPGSRRLDLGLLPLPDATALLRSRLGGRAAQEPEAVADLAARCAGLPLALRLAAELAAAHPARPLAEFAREVNHRTSWEQRLDRPGSCDVRAAVRAVFSCSYHRLPPAAARTFRLLGLHPGPDVDADATAALTQNSPLRSARLLELLARAHLLERTGPGRYGMHDLLRAYADRLARAHAVADERHVALDRLFDHYLATARAAVEALHPVPRVGRPEPPEPAPADDGGPADRAAALTWLDAERATLSAVCAYAADRDHPVGAVRLADVLSPHLDGHRPAEALAFHAHALRAAERLGDRAGQARALARMGVVRGRFGAWESAVDHLELALARYRQAGNPWGQARVLSELGDLYLRLGRYGCAARLQRQALGLFREAGDRHGEVVALNGLGDALRAAGRPAAAVAPHAAAARLAGITGQCDEQARGQAGAAAVERSSPLGRCSAPWGR